MRQATLCFLLRETDAGPEVLLALKKQGFGRGKWNGIGGKVDAGERVEQAARREVAEEIGVEVCRLEKVALLTFYFVPPGSDPAWNQEVHVFLVRGWKGEPAESAEMRPRWYAYEDVPYGEMWADDRVWLPRVLQGERISGMFTFSDAETIVHQEIAPWVNDAGGQMKAKQLLIVYFSETGHTEAMARAIIQGAHSVEGVDVLAKLADTTTNDDLLTADGIVLGSPTWFRLPAWPLKRVIDESIAIYRQLGGKVGGAFTSTGTFVDGIVCLRALMDMLDEHRIQMVGKGVLAIGAPDDDDLEYCRAYGRDVAACLIGRLQPWQTWNRSTHYKALYEGS